MSTWTNEDGLVVRFGLSRSAVVTDGTDAGVSTKVFSVTIPGNDLPAISNGGRDDIAHLPAGALITGAYAVATTGFGTDVGTLTIGFAKSDGTALNASGIDSAIDVSAALAADGDTVTCDGALVDGTETIPERAWVYATNSGSVVTGTVELYITYVDTNGR